MVARRLKMTLLIEEHPFSSAANYWSQGERKERYNWNGIILLAPQRQYLRDRGAGS